MTHHGPRLNLQADEKQLTADLRIGKGYKAGSVTPADNGKAFSKSGENMELWGTFQVAATRPKLQQFIQQVPNMASTTPSSFKLKCLCFNI